MSGPALIWDRDSLETDFVFEDGDYVADEGLATDVFQSLFEDRRANEGDVLPDDADPDLRGWWGDAFPVVEGDKRGSRLWLLGNALATQETLDRAQEYSSESLQWLIEDRVSNQVDVLTEFIGPEWMAITVTVHRPRQNAQTFRFHYNWAAHEGVRV